MTVAGGGPYGFSGDGGPAVNAHLNSPQKVTIDPFDNLFIADVSSHTIRKVGVYHYVLNSPRIRFLIADDPGAGKTIMAGLI